MFIYVYTYIYIYAYSAEILHHWDMPKILEAPLPAEAATEAELTELAKPRKVKTSKTSGLGATKKGGW